MEIDRVHRAEIAGSVVIDDAAGIESLHDGFGAQREFRIPRGPVVTRIMQSIDQVGVHVFLVARGVVAHRVQHDRWVVLRDAGVERGMARITVFLVGVGRLPIVMAEVRLRQRHQHACVVRGPEDLRKAQMRSRFAVVVVGVNEIDADTSESFEAFPRGLVGGKSRADVRVVERHGGEMNARPV